MENIIETKICRQCSNSFDITDIDIDFLDKLAPTIAGQIINLPLPTLCPDCSKLYRLAWRNENKIYKRKSDATQKDIITIFPPTSKQKVYEQEIWDSDFWDAKVYGRDFDFSRPFFEQISELIDIVPVPSKSTRFCENSDYCNAATYAKNCYLSFSMVKCEDLLYTVDATDSNNSTDCLGIYKSENCYECCLTYGGYNLFYSYDIQDCRDSRFLLSCIGCQNCYGCFLLENKQFYIYNKEYSKEDYFLRLKEILKLSIEEQKNIFEEFYKGKYVKPSIKNVGSENVTDSENITNCQNVSHCRHINGGQNVRYCQKLLAPTVNLAMNYNSYGMNVEKVYFSQQIGGNALSIYFCASVFYEVNNMFYSINCRNGVNNCFGCVGLKNAESYCILNKQYTKEEYEVLVPKIIEHMKTTGEWGEFFPPKLSFHGYNEAVTNIIKPLNKDEALLEGFSWSDYEPPFPKVEKTIPATKLPENIKDIPDDILNWAIECEVTKKPFRIVKPELEFYRKHNLPIPKKHPDQRYTDRLKWYINY